MRQAQPRIGLKQKFMSIKFGTDGWRAVIADTFTFENLERVAQATADYWKRHRVKGTVRHIIVGYDRRFLSEEFAQRTAEVLAANGFQVTLSDRPVPTPAVSWWVKASKAIGGVMITASHNPPIFNGFKLKAHYGGSASTKLCQGVEALLGKTRVKNVSLAIATRSGKVKVKDLHPRYFTALKKLVDFELIANSKLRFAHEALFGVGAGCFDQLLAGTTCRVTTLNGQHDSNFGGINPEPIEKNYARSQAYLKKHPHDICLVTDGDADRIGGMDGRGNLLTTHQLISLLLRHFVRNRRGTGKIAKALTTTSMVDKFCAAHGLQVIETGVGFKHIAVEQIKGGVLLGVEESGSIGFPGHVPERDGILSGLMLLEMLATEKKPVGKLLSELEKEFGPHRYARIDTAFPLDKRTDLMRYCAKNPPAKLNGSSVVDVRTFDGIKYVAEDSSWLILRGSGTEPILRIYAESSSGPAVQKLLKLGRKLTTQV
tara:strand:+ start:4722 stop:6179 length:1458 start_codon:yes stop_codon:yes gene_type:complete